jgi:hypothetical protein
MFAEHCLLDHQKYLPMNQNNKTGAYSDSSISHLHSGGSHYLELWLRPPVVSSAVIPDKCTETDGLFSDSDAEQPERLVQDH